MESVQTVPIDGGSVLASLFFFINFSYVYV